MPIPLGLAIAAGAGQVGGGIYNIAAGSKQRREGERLFEQQLEDLRSGKYDLSVSQAERDVADLARQYGEQLYGDVERRGAATQQATLFGLRGGDPRLASTLPASISAQDRAIYEAGQRAVGTGLAAQQRLAGMEQATLTQNQQFRRMLEQMQMQRGAAAGEAGRQQQVAGIGQIASAPMDLAALHIAGGGFESPVSETVPTPTPTADTRALDAALSGGVPAVPDYVTAGQQAVQGGAPIMINEPQFTGSGLGGINIGGAPLLGSPGAATPPAYTSPTYTPPDPFGLYQQIGGSFPFIEGEDGMKAPMVTPGEFDHDTNPIDMVAEDGTKVGEVTGGELIFNPDQSETIEELVEKGDGEALIMYLKQLLEQPQFEEQD